MLSAPLPPGAGDVLARDLDSCEKLQLAHAVRVADRPLALAELVDASGVEPARARDAIDELAAAGLVIATRDGIGATPALRSGACEAVLASYAEDCSRVLAALSTLKLGKVRTLAAHAYSRLPRKKPRE